MIEIKTIAEILDMCKELKYDKDTSNYVELGDEFEIPYPHDLWNHDKEICGVFRTKSFDTWICTDTQVGGKLWFFKDQPFAISTQECRKCKVDFIFFSMSITKDAFDYLHSLVLPEFPEFVEYPTDTKIELKAKEIVNSRSWY